VCTLPSGFYSPKSLHLHRLTTTDNPGFTQYATGCVCTSLTHRLLVSPHHLQKLGESKTVDAGRIILWGTSYSGGHVLATAAKLKDMPAIKGVIAQVCTFAA
jgi:hypothetical protein